MPPPRLAALVLSLILAPPGTVEALPGGASFPEMPGHGSVAEDGVPVPEPDPVLPRMDGPWKGLRDSVTFGESLAVLPNPERGFYRASPHGLDRLDPAFLQALYRDGYRLAYARIDLEAFRDRPLPRAYLDGLEAGFAAARDAGVKLIVRATYNYPRGETQYRSARDAPLPMVLRHIGQLRPVLRANADVVAFVQAGFVGAWGEWHTSSHALTSPEARTAIKDALLDAVPATRFVQFRYPPYLREWAPELPPADSAPPGAVRLGFHNDCFLASETDVGTFSGDPSVRAAEQDYLDRLGDLAPFGGETCNPADDPAPAPRNGCADILAEGDRYNLTYLNAGYYRPLFHEGWIAGGCAGEVARKMGYRLRLVEARYDRRAAAGGRVRLAVAIRNDGWARIYNPRAVEILLRSSASGEIRRLPVDTADPRRWLPGTVTPVTLDVALPGDLGRGAYDLLIALPDPAPRLRADPRYAIRPANADDRLKGQEWHAELGAFSLGARIEVE